VFVAVVWTKMDSYR